jgi:hypothetical protein
MRARRKKFGSACDFRYILATGSGCGVGVGPGGSKSIEGRVYKIIHPSIGCVALTFVATGLSNAALAADDFPLAGNYTQNVACKGDGSDPATAKVTISAQEIVSNVGICIILDTKKDGGSYAERTADG